MDCSYTSMSASKHPFYNPLDQTQIEFIPSDFDTVTGNLVARQRSDSGDNLSNADPLQSGDKDSLMGSRRGSFALSEIISQSVSRLHSRDTSFEETYRLTRISTTDSLSSSVVDRIRYKIVLKLNPKEKQLMRESWTMILNEEEVSSNQARPKQQAHKTFDMSNLIPVDSHASGEPSSESESSIMSATRVSEPKGNAMSNSFASSLFCSQFYANLLSMDPELERMFPSIRHQAVSFAGVLSMAIKNLDNLQLLESYLVDLGKRHARILDIEPPHFELMGAAFQKTLQDRFHVRGTLELEQVWSRLYSYLANSILQFGIDPVLQVNLNEDEIVFPVPNLVEGTGVTISRLNSRASHDGTRSLRSMFSSRDFGNNSQLQAQAQAKGLSHSQFQDHSSPHSHDQREMETPTLAPPRNGTAKILPNKKQIPTGRTKIGPKSKHKKVTSKLSLSNNEECMIM